MSKSREPLALRRGKAFHKKVQEDWARSSSDNPQIEHTIELSFAPRKSRRVRKGRMDVFYPLVSGYVSIAEVKGTDWDRIKPANITRNLGSHRRQIWKYILEYTDKEKVDVCAGVIYPDVPRTEGLRKRVEKYMGEYGIAVVWYNE